MPYREVAKRDWWRVGGYTLLTVAVIVVTGAILIPVAWPVGLVVWLAIFVSGSLFLLVRWHANNTAYRCPACGYEFEISVFTDFASLQVPDKKYLEMSALWQEELGDGAHEEGRAKRLFHPFQEGRLTFVAVDGAGRRELLHYLLLSRPDWPGRLASDRAATELLR